MGEVNLDKIDKDDSNYQTRIKEVCDSKLSFEENRERARAVVPPEKWKELGLDV